MKKLFLQIVKFGMVGGLCFLIDYGILIFLTEIMGIPYLTSSGISFTISVIVNYILSITVVFEAKRDANKLKEFILFIILSVIGLCLNQFIMWLCVEILVIHYMISKIGATAIVMVYNFITRKLFIEQKQ